jgi:hypothetical protein
MKLILAIIQDHVAQDVLHELSENKIRATKLSSTGGFFKKGNTTILIGIEDEKVDRVKEMILNISKNKETVDDITANTVMFVLNMDQLVRM